MSQSFVAVQGLYPFHCCEGRANSNSKPLQACTGKFTSSYSLVAALGLSLRLATGNQALECKGEPMELKRNPKELKGEPTEFKGNPLYANSRTVDISKVSEYRSLWSENM